VTPAVLNVLVEKFNIKPISNVADDLKAALAGNVEGKAS
jgi:hydroxylamine reductase (hybrid-cluster protein)